MSLLPDGASFEERVSDFFLACRGSGVMLSALDAELVMGWAREKIPFEVVARGIRKAAEKALWDKRPGEPALRSLRGCVRHVNAEIKKHLGNDLGRGDSAGETTGRASFSAHRKYVQALKKTAVDFPELAPTIGRLLGTRLAQAPENLADVEAVEELVETALLRALPFPLRRELLHEAQTRLEPAGALSWRARKLARRFHRSAVVRRKLSLPRF